MLESDTSCTYARAIQGERDEYGQYMNIVDSLVQRHFRGEPLNPKQAIRRLWAWVLPVVAMQTVVARDLDQGGSLDGDTDTMLVLLCY